MDFEFVADQKLKEILTRDYNELVICSKNNAKKASLVLTGSIMEAILVDFLSVLLKGKNINELNKISLGNLINIARENDLISEEVESISKVIKDYRNLIHPGKENRTKQKITTQRVEAAISLLKMLLEEVKTKYSETYTLTSRDIIEKLSEDLISKEIFEILLAKVRDHEKDKLYNSLIALHLKLPSTLHDPKIIESKKYLVMLRPKVSDETRISQLKILSNLIDKRNRSIIMEYYFLLNEDIQLLENKEAINIYKYVFYVLADTIENYEDVDYYCYREIYSSISKCYYVNELQDKVLQLIERIVFYGGIDGDVNYQIAYSQVINQYTDTEIKEIEVVYLQRNVEDSNRVTLFFREFDKSNYSRFN